MRLLVAVSLVVVSLAAVSALGGCSLVVALGLGAERGKAHVRDKTDVLADGHTVAFWERRTEAPRATLLLLHGMGGTRDHWTRFAQALPDDVDVIALDLPGFGESTKDPALRYDRASQVARVRAFAKQRGLARFHIVGNSMGGRIAVEYAQRFPDGIDSVILFNPVGLVPPEHPESQAPVIVRDATDFDALMRASFVKPPVLPGFLKQHFADEMQRNASFAAKVSADSALLAPGLADVVGALTVPVLVVWGEQDHIIDVSAASLWRATLRANPRADVVILPETGHAPMIERPHESAALVFTWWKARSVL